MIQRMPIPVLIGLLSTPMLASLLIEGCAAPGPRPLVGGDVDPLRGPRVRTLDAEPEIRVRLRRVSGSITLEAAGALELGPPGAHWDKHRRRVPGPVRIERREGAYLIRPARGDGLRWGLGRLRVQAAGGGPVSLGEARYPGRLRLVAPTTGGEPAAERFDLVNHVAIERYLPGVIAKELYGSWDPAAFRAQAIAARSYALAEAHAHEQRHYDLTSTTASQVYGGLTDNDRARDAARATRGEVLSYGGRVVPAYYSSTCGGTGQDAAAAFPTGLDIPPLRGQSGRTWCRASSRYRWGPIDRPREALSSRLRAWGRANRHPVAAMGGLRTVTVSRQSSAGRPAVFTLVDEADHRYPMRCEAFRQACNHQISSSQRLPSSHVRVRVGAATVRFEDGRGFGHGVGLCQFGAQGMAKAGDGHRQILARFYPGASVRPAY